MKINHKLLSIPPYISTSWNNITALHISDQILMVDLLDGGQVQVPGLDEATVERIFEVHSNILEEVSDTSTPNIHNKLHSFSRLAPHTSQIEQCEFPFRLMFNSMDEFSSALQHTPSQANTPEIPPEILQKIIEITRLILPSEIQFSKGEPHCNCIHCQMGRAIHQDFSKEVLENSLVTSAVVNTKEEIIKESDLAFQQWDILQTGDLLYSVVNRLDNKETYNVHLGNPVGCTCGRADCEHIIAVLKS